MRVVIVAELESGGRAGGIEQAVIGLAHGLTHLADGHDDYVFTTNASAGDWLQSYLGPKGRIVVRGGVDDKRSFGAKVSSRLHRSASATAQASLEVLRACFRATLELETHKPYKLQISDGFYEALAPDVLHFPYQQMVLSSIPTIFAPHDLQHLHYPEFFSQGEIGWREYYYRAWCRHATAVETSSHWTRADLIDKYSLAPSKVHAVLRGAPASLYSQDDTSPDEVRERWKIPERFCLYPAQTWPHKNHIRLIEAIAMVRDRDGIPIHLVCTGRKNDYWPRIAARIRDLDLEDRVQFLGFVPAADLRVLYRLARFVIYPTLFEGGGFPVLEALHEGSPLACSNVASLTEQAGVAALLFDPLSPGSITGALRRMSNDTQLRNTLRANGFAQVQRFTWDNCARHMRALYRTVAGQILSDEDRALLAVGLHS